MRIQNPKATLANIGLFDTVVEFQTDSEEESEQIGNWVSHVFSDHFVLLEHFSSKIYAGGCTDNAQGWDQNWNERDKKPSANYYELRCSEKDSVVFFLKFGQQKDTE